MRFLLFLLISSLALVSCSDSNEAEVKSSYYVDSSSGLKTGGVKVISISSNGKDFKVWTKRIGNNPRIKLLLLNGGPGLTHEYFECFESFLPAEGIEFIYYDQLGTGNSDNPADSAYWDLGRYVEEVEQVRAALGLTKDNFYLLGHSWGGILSMQYALKYQQNLKGLIISNMMSSCPEYGRYADEVLAKGMNKAVVDTINLMESRGEYSSPRYMELLIPNFYEKHFLRIPAANWPEPVSRSSSKINIPLYVTMQGPSEFGIAGRLANWDIRSQLKNISVPTLTIGGKHDTMDPEHMKWMSGQVQKGSYLFCPNGSHMSMYDDQETYMRGLIQFIKAVDSGKEKIQL